MRILRGQPEREQVAGLVVRRERGARLERRGDEPRDLDALAHDVRRRGERAVDVAFRMLPAEQDVTRRVRLDDHRKLVVVDQDELCRIGGARGGLRDDDGDGLADEADAVAG